jgi:hypothetical protein
MSNPLQSDTVPPIILCISEHQLKDPLYYAVQQDGKERQMNGKRKKKASRVKNDVCEIGSLYDKCPGVYKAGGGRQT